MTKIVTTINVVNVTAVSATAPTAVSAPTTAIVLNGELVSPEALVEVLDAAGVPAPAFVAREVTRAWETEAQISVRPCGRIEMETQAIGEACVWPIEYWLWDPTAYEWRWGETPHR
jgi:hypothetical protein